ncbi:isopenicillin N synthase family oxygenase [Alkalilimnicola ehrlichii]|uniref:isopenicillin N synthase family dioxygenase n=1 Tax=Alkalilimnicola ehrlichii TaxID=351052 RepID=UPI001C6E5E85|nr:2-oxoglutarate and iron-dependent oxygenase domain-containing protein [Alkalilimnicola ehrlichii]
MTLKYVPIVDLAPYFDGTSTGKREVAAQVDKACKDIGFLVITNHGVPAELIERVSRLSSDFFDLPLEAKRRVDRPSPDQVRGYSAVAEESLSYSLEEAAPGDLKESFSIGPTDVPDEPYYHCEAAGPHFAPNVWPTGIDGFQNAYTEYFAAMSDLSQSLMRIFALALELPETFFDDKIDKHISMFRTLSYPDTKGAVEEGQMRASAHTDYGSLTIVRPDSALGGLQVRNQDGQWVDVPYVPDGFVVNIGDLMMHGPTISGSRPCTVSSIRRPIATRTIAGNRWFSSISLTTTPWSSAYPAVAARTTRRAMRRLRPATT